MKERESNNNTNLNGFAGGDVMTLMALPRKSLGHPSLVMIQ